MPAFEPVEAVLRSLKVLETVSRLEQCGVGEIQAATGLSRATVIRMLETLQFAGYVARAPEAARWSLTSRVRLLNAGYRAHDELARRATPILGELQARVAWPCDLAVYDGAEMVIVAGNPAQGRLFYNRGPGYRAQVLGASLGLAYIAFTSALERRRVLAQSAGRGPGESALPADPADAEAALTRVREQGYAMVDHAAFGRPAGASLAAIAAPVLVHGRPVAAVNVIFLREVLAPDEAPAKLLAPLQAAAAGIAAAVGELYDEPRSPELQPAM